MKQRRFLRAAVCVGTLLFLTSQGLAFISWPGNAGYPSDPADRIHHYKEEAVVGNNYMSVMLDANGSIYDIYFPSVGFRQGSGTANEGYKGPEEFIGGPFGCPTDLQANGQMNAIAGMGGIEVGGTIYWLKNDAGSPGGVHPAGYVDHTQSYVTDNNVVQTSARLTGGGANILVEQYAFCPTEAALPEIVPGSNRDNGVLIKRFLLTNQGGSSITFKFYYDVNFNIKGDNAYDQMYVDPYGGYNTMVAYDRARRTVTGTGCAPNGYGGSASTEYNPTTFGSYDKFLSVYFGTAMKLVTNPGTGQGSPADGTWRDHTGDNHEGWIGKEITLLPGEQKEVDVAIIGAWDDFDGATGTFDFWGRPLLDWFFNNSMATAQTTTETYWSNWLNSGVTIDFPGTAYDDVWKRQKLIAALHFDKATGAIIAGMHNGAYPFSWPRDAIYAAITLDRAGHLAEAEMVYQWLRDTAFRAFDPNLGGPGFFYQKYTTDGYIVWNSPQIDETAGVPWGLWYHYRTTGDGTFLNNYANLARETARAASETSGLDSRAYYDGTFNLMHGNNLWEDSFGLFAYSNESVVRGLRDAAEILTAVGDGFWPGVFLSRANTILNNGVIPRLNFRVEPSDISHLGGEMPFQVLDPTTAQQLDAVDWIHGTISAGGFFDNLVESGPDVGGLLRRYNHNVGGNIDNYWGGGPWFLSTSWYGQYYSRWQDYVPGDALVDVNLDKLDLLLAKLGPNGVGAEQIAPNPGLQKYPGFWLQAAWPNVWESSTMLMDQMMMFLDYDPGVNGEVVFRPKLPSSWTTMSYNNMYYQGQQYDITITEDGCTVRADLDKLTAGNLDIDITLRVPAGSSVNMAVLNDTFDAAPDYNPTIGSVRIQGALTAAAGANVAAVTFGACDYDGDGALDSDEINVSETSPIDPDTDNDGLPDGFEIDNGLDPHADDACADLDGDGVDNETEYQQGTDPSDAGSLLAITGINTLPGGDIEVTWASVPGQNYQLLATADPVNQPLTAISGVVASGGASTSFVHAAPAYAQYKVIVVP